MADGHRGRWGGDLLAPVIAIAIVVALIGVLLLPMLHQPNAGSANGANVLGSSKDVLCYGCTEDAPYPMLLFLELVVAVSGLLIGFGLCFRGEGWVVVGRTVALVAAGLILLWVPLQTQAEERPIAIAPLFVALGIGAIVLAVVVGTALAVEVGRRDPSGRAGRGHDRAGDGSGDAGQHAIHVRPVAVGLRRRRGRDGGGSGRGDRRRRVARNRSRVTSGPWPPPIPPSSTT